MANSVHIPVLLNEMRDAMQLNKGGVYVDTTFGGGGYTKSFFEQEYDIKVIGLDRDPTVNNNAQKFEKKYNFEFIQTNFGVMEGVLTSNKTIEKNGGIDGVVFDIGVSSFQIDEAKRGFSFMRDGPLDMRMDNAKGDTAADIVNQRDEKELADIFYLYGEERHSRRVAKAVVKARPLHTTKELADLIEAAIPKSKDKTHPAARCFQALRIVVNDELGELERGLEAAAKLLKKGGRLVVITFHSLEDRIVKNFIAEQSGQTKGVSRFKPILIDDPANQNIAVLRRVTKKPIIPADLEVKSNPRARSAKMRVAEKISDFQGVVS